MMKKFIIVVSSFLPSLALAQAFQTTLDTTDGTIGGIMATVFQIINFLVPIFIAAGVAFFIYAVIRYMAAKDEEQKATYKGTMVYAIIGLFVITSIWGLVAVLNNTFGIQQGGGIGQKTPCIYDNPTVPGPC
jgi:hypothetical protein